MQAILDALEDNGGISQIELPSDKVVRVGRDTAAEIAFPNDRYMSSLHFALGYREGKCYLSDLGSSNGTFVNGARTQKATLQNGDQILAGQTRFRIRMNNAPPQLESRLPSAAPLARLPATVVLNHAQRRLLQIFREQRSPLFAVLDAAQTGRIVELLDNSGEQYQSLYEGQSGLDLANFAPYLVQLGAASALLPVLIKESWGNNWGIYLACEKPFAEVRKHLRHFLLVHTEQGKELLFRFYDPRILSVFLPTCTAEQVQEFMGPIQGLFMEDDVPENLLRYLAGGKPEKLSLLPPLKPSTRVDAARRGDTLLGVNRRP